MRAKFFSHDYAHSKTVWRWDKRSLCKQCCHSPPALAMPEPGAQSRQGLQAWPTQRILGSEKQQDTNTSLISGWQLTASAPCFKGHWRVLHWQRGLRSPAKQPPSLHQKNSCYAEANTVVGWCRFPGKTYVVQVGEFDFQGGEERPGKWLHSHGDDFGVQNSAVPGKKRGKSCFKGD